MKNSAEANGAHNNGAPEGFSVSHLSDSEFVPQGLRAFFEYRELGTKGATKGRIGAHIIRARPGTQAEPQWHNHQLEFQMVYVTRGWILFEYEGVGEVRLEAGSCVHQAPGIRHRELAHSDDLELIEITLPADFGTTNLAAP